jgi:hypothetical protein
VLATEAFLPFLKRRSRPVSGPLKGSGESVNAFLQFYFKQAESPGNLPLLRVILG